jgi:hypothetical protein
LEKNAEVCETEQDLDLESKGITRTYCKQTGCKRIYVSIIYKDDEPFKKIDYIKIYGEARSNDCGCSALESLADLISFILKRVDVRKRSEGRLLVKALRDHRCNKPCLASPKDRTLSCSDAVAQILQAELQITNEELRGRA